MCIRDRFIGYLVAGVPGAVLATVAIFLPGFVFVAITNPFIPRLRRSPWLSALLDGVVAEADDGDAARRLIAAHQPDVAVLDIQMPRATGIEVARWSRATHPAVGVLILTAYDDDPYVAAALQAGANGYVLKTAVPAALIRAVRDVHEGKQALDAAIRARAVTPVSYTHLDVYKRQSIRFLAF